MILLISSHFTRSLSATTSEGKSYVLSTDTIIQTLEKIENESNTPIKEVVFSGIETDLTQVIKKYYTKKGITVIKYV